MSGSEAPRNLRLSGFTLLELMVTLVIAAALVALVPPMLQRALPSVQLKGASQELASALRFLRSWSIAQGREGRLILDLQNKNYTITPRTVTYDLPQDTEVTLQAAQDEHLDGQRSAIRFYPDGSSSGGRVTLKSAANERRIDVDWLTGRVSLVP
ncbi:MAG: GspH/FimT family pseudopilin [Candidatus Thiodiazotropha sp.]|jgi:general secretion pathway protein H